MCFAEKCVENERVIFSDDSLMRELSSGWQWNTLEFGVSRLSACGKILLSNFSLQSSNSL